MERSEILSSKDEFWTVIKEFEIPVEGVFIDSFWRNPFQKQAKW